MQNRTSVISLSSVLAKGWGWIVRLALLGAALGVAAGFLWPKTYEASAVLILSEQPGGQLSMETEQLVASSTEIMTHAAEGLGTTAAQVRQAVSVSVPRGAKALRFTAEADQAGRAAELANAVAVAYRDQGTDAAALEAQVGQLQARVDDLGDRLAEATPGSSRARALVAELDSTEQQLLDLQIAAEAPAQQRGRLVTPAVAPSSPATPGVVVFGAGGLMAGAISGAALAMLLGRLALRQVPPRTVGTVRAGRKNTR
ncbi:Wzz/FepE/Etk N-terminal domain-containing protein [Ornithinimicrobium panacihumi]|uniref:Wzz/FepE/Etk N-terminal domain-containing protein n=1 Tax=Ornithinimicrobium panacihumi TaxID=2008449 RepID=UPI003F88994F